MKLYFNINYKTVYGEELLLNVVDEKADGTEKITSFRMSTVDGWHWFYEMNRPASAQYSVLRYFYSVDCEGAERRHEWLTEVHQLELNGMKVKKYDVFDRWIDFPEDSYLYSSAFTECVNRRELSKVYPSTFDKVVRLVVRAPQLGSNLRLMVCGKGEALGCWDVLNAVPMYEHTYNEWMVDLNADALGSDHIEFKFAAVDAQDSSRVFWETGFNRTLDMIDMKEGEMSVYTLDQTFFEICDRKLAGTLVPVFSLRSKTSFGVGDFGDLKKMIDWVALTHQRVLQVLPINDTTTTHTWQDSYPYSCISIFALHPQYADLTQLPALNDKKKRDEFEALRLELNALRQIDNGSCLMHNILICVISIRQLISLAGPTITNGTRKTARLFLRLQTKPTKRWLSSISCSMCFALRCKPFMNMLVRKASF